MGCMEKMLIRNISGGSLQNGLKKSFFCRKWNSNPGIFQGISLKIKIDEMIFSESYFPWNEIAAKQERGWGGGGGKGAFFSFFFFLSISRLRNLPHECWNVGDISAGPKMAAGSADQTWRLAVPGSAGQCRAVPGSAKKKKSQKKKNPKIFFFQKNILFSKKKMGFKKNSLFSRFKGN